MLVIFRKLIKEKKGEEMVEAGIAVPIIIIITVMLIRLTVFFYEVLSVRVKIHENLLSRASLCDKCYIKLIEEEDIAYLSESFDLKAVIYSKEYIYSESSIVMVGDLIE